MGKEKKWPPNVKMRMKRAPDGAVVIEGYEEQEKQCDICPITRRACLGVCCGWYLPDDRECSMIFISMKIERISVALEKISKYYGQ